MSTLKLEILKLWKRKTTWFAVLVILFAMCGLFYFQEQSIRQMEQTNQRVLGERVTLYQTWSEEKHRAADTLEAEGQVELAEQERQSAEQYQKSYERSLARQAAYVNKDWDTFYQQDLEQLDFFLDPSNYASYSIEEQDVSWFTIRVAKEEKQAFLAADANPMLQSTTQYGMMASLYDTFTGYPLSYWKMETRRLGTEGWTMLLDFVKVQLVPIVLLITIFLFGNTVSSELSRKRRGLDFYRVVPVPTMRVFWAKYVAGLSHVLLFSLLFLSIPLILAAFSRGLGSLAFPVLIYGGPDLEKIGGGTKLVNPETDPFSFIPLSEYMMQAGLLGMSLAVAGYSLYFLVALWIRQPGVTLLVTLAIVFGAKYAWQHAYNPFQYLEIDRIITQQNRVLLFDFGYSWELGILLLCMTGAVLTALAIVGFQKVQVK